MYIQTKRGCGSLGIAEDHHTLGTEKGRKTALKMVESRLHRFAISSDQEKKEIINIPSGAHVVAEERS